MLLTIFFSNENNLFFFVFSTLITNENDLLKNFHSLT